LEQILKHFRLSLIAVASMTVLNVAVAQNTGNIIGPATTPNLIPGKAASLPGLTRPDLTAASAGAQFGFVVRNIGSGNAPASATTVTCTAWVAPSLPTKLGGSYVPCVEGTHYVTGPGTPPPAGTVKGANVWKVPTPALAANTGQTTFSINIKTTATQKPRGLNFKVCADAGTSVAESNEGNNCQDFNYTWPN
jgi:hypothetical protein